jgi:hypothetical protein
VGYSMARDVSLNCSLGFLRNLIKSTEVQEYGMGKGVSIVMSLFIFCPFSFSSMAGSSLPGLILTPRRNLAVFVNSFGCHS